MLLSEKQLTGVLGVRVGEAEFQAVDFDAEGAAVLETDINFYRYSFVLGEGGLSPARFAEVIGR